MKSSILQNSNEKFEGFLSKPLKRGQIKKNYQYFFYFLKYESAFTFLTDLFLEARAEILQNFQLLFLVN